MQRSPETIIAVLTRVVEDYFLGTVFAHAVTGVVADVNPEGDYGFMFVDVGAYSVNNVSPGIATKEDLEKWFSFNEDEEDSDVQTIRPVDTIEFNPLVDVWEPKQRFDFEYTNPLKFMQGEKFISLEKFVRPTIVGTRYASLRT